MLISPLSMYEKACTTSTYRIPTKASDIEFRIIAPDGQELIYYPDDLKLIENFTSTSGWKVTAWKKTVHGSHTPISRHRHTPPNLYIDVTIEIEWHKVHTVYFGQFSIRRRAFEGMSWINDLEV